MCIIIVIYLHSEAVTYAWFQQMELSFYSPLYDLIPSHHILKKVNEHIDFSFVGELLKENYCEYYGRPAKEPEFLFRILFLQTHYNLSDVQIIEEAQVNLAYKWFLSLNPEDELPDPSLLSKFRRHHVGVLEVILNNIVEQAIDKGLIKSSAILIDATHSYAGTKRNTPLKVLIKAGKKLRKAVQHERSDIAALFPLSQNQIMTKLKRQKNNYDIWPTWVKSLRSKQAQQIKPYNRAQEG